jgi:CelD/BcsL family acetyltransferase involved in cellulose biosynthesis
LFSISGYEIPLRRSFSMMQRHVAEMRTEPVHAFSDVAGKLQSSARLTVVENVASLRAMEADWRALESTTLKPTRVFQSFDWLIAWAETYMENSTDPSLHILTGYDHEQLVFAWPLMRERKMGISILTWMTDPFGQYGDVLCRNDQNARQWLNSSLQLLKRLNDVDLIRLRHVRADSLLAQYGTDLFRNANVPDKAPALELTSFTSEADYDARYTSSQRKRRKKIRTALEELGTLGFKSLTTGALADAAMQLAIDEKNAWLKERGRMNRVLGCPSHLTFLRKLSLRKNATVEVVVTELKAGERPVSWEIGFRHQSIHYGYITSHVNALTDYSPGRLHMDLSQRACLKVGMHEFDLMVPNDAHKASWSNKAVDTQDYYLPLSFAGAVVGHGYVRLVRPLLRRTYYWFERQGNSATWLKFFRPKKKKSAEGS